MFLDCFRALLILTKTIAVKYLLHYVAKINKTNKYINIKQVLYLKHKVTFTKSLLKILNGILYCQGTNDSTGFYEISLILSKKSLI